jgi:hypothetical protein
MSGGGLSKARLGRMHDVMAGHVERGENAQARHADQPVTAAAMPRQSGYYSDDAERVDIAESS